MKALTRLLGGALLLTVLSACTSTGSVSGSGGPLPDGTTPGADGTVYDTRGGVADTYGYNPDGTPRGEALGGPGANQSQRTVYFDFDSATVRADSMPVVEAHARYLAGNPATVTTLEGHADERGTREYNIGLGDRRAGAVRQLLIAYGVSPSQLQTVSYGEERPAVMGSDEYSYSLNRRVEFAY
jgi:peptidoglycan-associated lipoprotein